MGTSYLEPAEKEVKNRKEEPTGVKGHGREPGNTLAGADGIRAIACLAVIIHHVCQRVAIQSQPVPVQEVQLFLLLGNTGVSIFFVLSGFLLSYPFWKQFLNGGAFPDIRQYALRRAARIMPGYYASFLVCTLIILLFRIPSDYFWIRLFSGLTFTAGFHYTTFFPNEINSPFWSVSFEVFCYLLMPLFMYGMFRLFPKKRSFVRGLVYWIAAGAFLALVNRLIHVYLTPDDFQRGWQFGNMGGAKYWMPNYNPVGFFGHFAVGILAAGVTAWLYRRRAGTGEFGKFGGFDVTGAAGLLGAVILLWSVRHAPDFSLSFQSQPYYFPLFALFIGVTLATAPHSKWVGKLLDNSFFRYTARISFGLYIWHFLVIYVTGSVIFQEYQTWTMTDLIPWASISLLVIAVSYLIAAASYRFVEKPVLDRVHRKSQ